MRNHFNQIILSIIVILFVSCTTNVPNYKVDLNHWTKFNGVDNHQLGNFIRSYNFHHKLYKFDKDKIYANVLISTGLDNSNDTVIVFDVNYKSIIDTTECETCRDLSFTLKKEQYKEVYVPEEFKYSRFNDSNKYKYIFGEEIYILIDD